MAGQPKQPRPGVQDYLDGMAVPDIAAKYNVLPQTVQLWLDHHGRSYDKDYVPTEQDIQDRLAKRRSIGDIARAVGVTRARVRHQLALAGVPVVRRVPNTSVVLTEEDDDWLRQYQPGIDTSQPARKHLDGLIAAGSQHIYKDATPPDQRQRIIGARRAFLKALGISEKGVLPSARNLPLPNGIVTNSRLLAGYGVNVRKAGTRGGGVLSAKPERLESVICYLRALGVNVQRVFDRQPDLFTRDPELLRNRLAYLQSLGANVRKVLYIAPEVVLFTRQGVDDRIACLQKWGVADPIALVNRHPHILARGLTTYDTKGRLLEGLGLDPGLCLTASSAVFSQAKQTILAKVRILRTLGKLLGCPGVADECLHRFNILSTSKIKLFFTARICVTYASAAGAPVDVNLVRRMSVLPMPAYIITLAEDSTVRPSLADLHRDVERVARGVTPSLRESEAFKIASSGALGEIGRRYLQYHARTTNWKR